MTLKIKLYLFKINTLIDFGIKNGLIVPFDDSYYNELNNTIVSTIPVGIDIKYLKPKVRPGKCYDRSLKMFYAMDNSLLVRGSLEYFRIQGDETEENHGWVEKDGYVYDPTWLARFDKDFYYKIFKVQHTIKCTHDEYCAIDSYNNYYYGKIKSTTRESLKNDWNERCTLAMTIPLLSGIAESNPEFQSDLNKYLKEINYDEEEIETRIDSEIKNMIGGKL